MSPQAGRKAELGCGWTSGAGQLHLACDPLWSQESEWEVVELQPSKSLSSTRAWKNSCVSLAKAVHLLEPQFLHLYYKPTSLGCCASIKETLGSQEEKILVLFTHTPHIAARIPHASHHGGTLAILQECCLSPTVTAVRIFCCRWQLISFLELSLGLQAFSLSLSPCPLPLSTVALGRWRQKDFHLGRATS